MCETTHVKIFQILALSVLVGACVAIQDVQVLHALQALHGQIGKSSQTHSSPSLLDGALPALETQLIHGNVTKNVTSAYHHHVCKIEVAMAGPGDVFMVFLAFFMSFGVYYSLRCFQIELKELKAEKAEILMELMASKDKEVEARLEILNERMVAKNKEAKARENFLNELMEVKDKEAKTHFELLDELRDFEDKEAKARLEIQDLKNQIKEIKVENENVKEKLSIAEVQVTDGKKALERSEEHVKEYQAAAALAEERISECQVAAAKAEVRANDYQAAATMATIKADERISEYQVAAAKAEARADKSAADAEDRVSDQTKLAFDLSEVVKVQVEQTLADSAAVKKLVEQMTERLPRIETEAFRRGREAGLAEARQPASK
ncbi:hypothetical protein CPLU01_07941 [Colletotrichum plurivorum]|uniref:Uncharacterized protein n=1 Tax=Colletotrichum plurivorum TaxID=2175906 RepID=A0A8H6NDZ6_9PEZI|nr:hypothetical protein CPLU01_07941 [Colletotrichum plurivorum]